MTTPRWPFPPNIPSPGMVNDMPSVPGEQFMRSIDPPEGTGGGGGAAPSGYIPPLTLVQVDPTHIKVRLGTVSGFVPTNVNTSIDVSGTNGVWWFYLHATIAAKSVTAVALLSNIGGPVPTDDGNNSYRLVGQVTVSGGVITLVDNAFGWSQSVVTCTDDTAPHIWETGA